MLIISQIITQLLTSTMSVISESNCQQETEKWPFSNAVYFFFVRSKLSGEESCISFLSLSGVCLHRESEEYFSYLLMAFFKYCCSHLVSGLMQTSLLFFSLALWEKKEEFEGLDATF